MFTGIVEGLGTISNIRSSGRGKQITADAEFSLDGTHPGDSIAVNGACLTAVVVAGNRFQADVSPETLSKTTFGRMKIGERVNLERALRFSDRLDGHLVSGHIDGIGTITQRKSLDNSIIITVAVAESLARYLIDKGSVALDGISLTVNECRVDGFDVSIIPHTAKTTTLHLKKQGDSVNIETDMIGKYVERFMGRKDFKDRAPSLDKPSFDMQFLEKTGFLK